MGAKIVHMAAECFVAVDAIHERTHCISCERRYAACSSSRTQTPESRILLFGYANADRAGFRLLCSHVELGYLVHVAGCMRSALCGGEYLGENNSMKVQISPYIMRTGFAPVSPINTTGPFFCSHSGGKPTTQYPQKAFQLNDLASVEELFSCR